MTLIDHAPAPVADASSAARLARDHLSANSRSLAETQPELEIVSAAAGLTWVRARDGALTAVDEAGRWCSGCSVPRAAAQAMLKRLDVRGVTGCFLSPPHAAALRIALDALRPEQAIIAIVPDAAALTVLLSCENFAAEITAGRLWFVAGTRWAEQLDELLTTHPGLPTPTQFVRLLDGIEESIADALVSPAQRAFSVHAARRAARIAQLRTMPRPSAHGGACVIAPSLFRLWDDAGDTLGRLADVLGWLRFDPDAPASASPLALAERAAGAKMLLAPNSARCDFPELISPGTGWVTWVTRGRIPSYDATTGPHDALLLSDPRWRSAAIEAGWPNDRVHPAGWPAAPLTGAAPAGPLVLIADVRPLDPPARVIDFSSHRLLWELIRDELGADPFLATPCIDAYLDARLARFAIDPQSLDRRSFIDDLIVPAFIRGIARVLADEGLMLRVHGAGWEAEPKLASCWRGVVRSREAFREAVATAGALVHPWPRGGAHPIDAMGRPVVRALAGRAHMRRSAAAVGSGTVLSLPKAAAAPLSGELLATLFDQMG